MNKIVRDQYNPQTIHPEVIDIAFGFLKSEDASSEANIIIEESGLKQYIQKQDDIIGEIEQTLKGDARNVDNLLSKLLKQNSHRNIELSTILSHLLQTKKPLSYKLVSYDEIIIQKPQKFIIATNNPFGPMLEDITLITGTGNKLHADHLTRFITDHVNSSSLIDSTGDFEGLFKKFAIDSRIGSSVHTLKGGWFEKQSENLIHVYDSSGGYGMTSNTTAGEVFRNLFPNHTITTDTK